jgi:hypothetical protein
MCCIEIVCMFNLVLIYLNQAIIVPIVGMESLDIGIDDKIAEFLAAIRMGGEIRKVFSFLRV